MPAGDRPTVLHFMAADADRGGILSVVRNLASAGEFNCVAGVNPGFRQRRVPLLETFECPAIAGDTIAPATMFRARAVARAVRRWLQADGRRIFHGHSRAGLLVALWLQRLGERRVVVSVHCYGRQRWFYRWAARRLGGRLFWLSPAMRHYYGLAADDWAQCLPGCLPGPVTPPGPRRPPVGRLCLGGVGTIVRWKRWDLVLAAMARLPAALRDRVIFEHLGEPDGSPDAQACAAELRDFARTHGLESRVRWRGAEPSSAALLAAVDFLVVASANEPLSVAMLEALAAGVPVVAADSGGALDVLTPGRTGWWFRTGDAGALAQQIAALGEPTTWRDVRITADDLSRFAASVVAGQWRRVYDRLLSETP